MRGCVWTGGWEAACRGEARRGWEGGVLVKEGTKDVGTKDMGITSDRNMRVAAQREFQLPDTATTALSLKPRIHTSISTNALALPQY